MGKYSIQAASLFLKTIFIFIIASACSNRGKILATVGHYTIQEKDAEQREQITKIFYPNATEKNIGLTQLTEAYSYAQILENHGMEINSLTLEQEAARIDKETRNPATINQIKNIFGKDHKSYLKVFVLPTFAERIIYFGFFLHDSQAQAEPLRIAQNILQATKVKPQTLDTEAKKYMLKVDSYTYDSTLGFQQSEMKKRKKKELPQELPPEAKRAIQEAQTAAHDAEAAYFKRNQAFTAAKGTILKEPFDAIDFFLILQVSAPSNAKKLSFRGVIIPKKSYAEWLSQEKSKFAIKIHEQ